MATRRKQSARAKQPAKRKPSPNRSGGQGADALPVGFVRLEVRGLQQLTEASLLRLLRRSCRHAADLRARRKSKQVATTRTGWTPCDDESCTLLEQLTLPDGTRVRIFDCNGAIVIYVVT